jgi:hypothetical protein
MFKGYPIGAPLQTILIAQSSAAHCHIQYANCGKIAALPLSCSPHAHNQFNGEVASYRLDQAS